jgi:CspA family cold shock protein
MQYLHNVFGGLLGAGLSSEVVVRLENRGLKSVFDQWDFWMATGTVKWFNEAKGYGFIIPDEGGPDVFVHATAVKRSGYAFLPQGARISYQPVAGSNSKTSAENIRIA